MSLPTEVPLRCTCGHSFTFTFWGSVNTRDEDLKQSFLIGTLNVYKCPKCHESSFVPLPVLYHDMERGLLICVYDGTLSEDPRREADPKWASLLGALREEILAADDFDCARLAIAALEDSAAFARIRAVHRDWPDSKVYAQMFEQSFQAAKERLNEPLVPSPQPDTGITGEELEEIGKRLAEKAMQHSSAVSGVGMGKDFASEERAALERILAQPLVADDANEAEDSEPSPRGIPGPDNAEHGEQTGDWSRFNKQDGEIAKKMVEQTNEFLNIIRSMSAGIIPAASSWATRPPAATSEEPTPPLRTSPEVIAVSLYEVLVQESCQNECKTLLEQAERMPSPTARSKFFAKVETYRKAVVLMALISVARKRQEFEQVLQAYEVLVFGPAPTPSSRKTLDAVKAAMADLQQLFHGAGGLAGAAWSRAWIEAIGYTENNPVRLSLFAWSWMDDYIAAVRAIQKFSVAKN